MATTAKANDKRSILTASDKPPRVSVNPDNIPDELKQKPRWVCWQYQWKVNSKGGKWQKVPVMANGQPAASTDPATWTSFDAAFSARERHDGIGFVLGDGYTGIDLDNCRDTETTSLSPTAESIVSRFNSYAEISPTGTGVKVFVLGEKPQGRCKSDAADIELYSSGRYFTVTGWHLDDTPRSLTQDDGGLEWLQRGYIEPPNLTDVQYTSTVVDDVEIAREALGNIPAKYASSHHDWVRVAYAAKSTDLSLRDDWIAWSRKGDGYVDDEDCAATWEKIKPSGSVGIATLIHLAKESGWKPTRAENQTTSGRNPQNSREIGGFGRGHKDEGPNLATPELHPFVPFPTHTLPEPVARYIQETAKATCCDESFVAMPLIAGLAAAVGNSHALQIKRGWNAPPIVWPVTIAPSGAGKSAPMRHALKPIFDRQKRLFKEYDAAHKKYQAEQEIYLRDLADFKKSKGSVNEPPEPPVEPICQRSIVNDTTIEALGKKLRDNPRGLLSANDELSVWFASFSRYKSGSTSDEGKWLEFFSAQTSIIDRSSAAKPIVIDRAAVCVTGTIQPGILKKQLTSDHKASGLAARLLFAMPPMRVKQWSEYEVPVAVEETVSAIFDALFGLEMRFNEDGNPQPNFIQMDDHAKGLFVRYFNRHNKEQQELDGELYAAFSKLEEYAARFALIIHCTEWATNPRGAPLGTLTADSMAAGIELCEWFKNEAKRVYALLSEDDLVAENRALISWCARQAEPITARDLYRHKRSLGDSQTAEKLLQKFVEAGFGTWENLSPDQRGGRPTRGFVSSIARPKPLEAQGITGFRPEHSTEATFTGEPWNANALLGPQR